MIMALMATSTGIPSLEESRSSNIERKTPFPMAITTPGGPIFKKKLNLNLGANLHHYMNFLLTYR